MTVEKLDVRELPVALLESLGPKVWTTVGSTPYVVLHPYATVALTHRTSLSQEASVLKLFSCNDPVIWDVHDFPAFLEIYAGGKHQGYDGAKHMDLYQDGIWMRWGEMKLIDLVRDQAIVSALDLVQRALELSRSGRFDFKKSWVASQGGCRVS